MSEYTYRTGGYGKLIEQLEVVKETDKQIVVLERGWNGGKRESRCQKRSCYYNHFDTFEEAKAYLIERNAYRIESLREQLARAESSHQVLADLQEDANEPV